MVKFNQNETLTILIKMFKAKEHSLISSYKSTQPRRLILLENWEN